MHTLSEADIKKTIMDYLEYRSNGFVMEIQVSGRPLITKGGFKMIPFKGKYFRSGMSDVFYVENGKFYAFEVKKPTELKWWIRNKAKIMMQNPKQITNKKHKHFYEQQEFIHRCKKAGCVADFVCSLRQVVELLPDLKK